MSPRLRVRDDEQAGASRVGADLLEGAHAVGPERLEERELGLRPDDVGRHGVDHARAEAHARVGGRRPAGMDAGREARPEGALGEDRGRRGAGCASAPRPRRRGRRRAPSRSGARPRAPAPSSELRGNGYSAPVSGERSRGAGGCEDRRLVERHNCELGWRPAEEAVEEHELVCRDGIGRGRARQRLPGRDEPGSDLERRAGAGRERANGGDPPAGDEEGLQEAILHGGREQAAAASRAAARGARARCDHGLERPDPVTEPRRVLVAKAVGEVAELGAEPRERPAGREERELALARSREGTRRELGPAPAPDRPEPVRLRADDDPVAATPKVDAAVGPERAGVRRRPELADQPRFLERGLELGAEHAPLDPLEREERGLDGGPLPLGAEVRAQPGPQVAGAADVEHLVVPVTEEVDARPRRGAEGERALAVDAPHARSGQLEDVADGAAPRSWARPRSATSASAVACASGSAR